MTDSVTVFPPGWRLTDANDDPISGGTIEFYTAGTSTPKTVYSDSALATSVGTSVTTDAGGYPTSGGNKCSIYTTTTALKIILKDAAGSSIVTHENFRPVNITTSSGAGAAAVEVHPKTADFTAVSGDDGYLFQCDPTGGSFQCTLTSAVTLGNGWSALFRHDGTANQVKIATGSGQYIKLPGSSTTAGIALTGKGHLVRIVCDGAGFVVAEETHPLIGSRLSVFTVADRVTAFPSSPVSGARYLFNGTPTGTAAAAGYSTNDIAEYDGRGTYIKHTPAADCGWLAYVQDEDLYTSYQSSGWVDLANATAPASTVRKIAIIEDQKSNGTDGGTATTGSFTNHVLNTFVNSGATNVISGLSLASNQVTIPAGTYLVRAWAVTMGTNTFQIRFKSTTTATVIDGLCVAAPNATPDRTTATAHLAGVLTLSAQEIFTLDYYASGTFSTQDLGVPTVANNGVERYASVTIEDMTTTQGPQGTTGTTGAAGPGYAATSTSSVALGSSGSKTFTTQSGLAYAANMRVRAAYDASNYMEGVVTSYSGSTLAFTSDRSVGSGTYTSWNIGIAGDVGPTGSTGATGSAGSTGATGATGPNVGLDYQWSTSTSGDPGSGKLLVNNATPASATQLNISETNRQSASQAAYIATWDDSTTSTNKGVVRILDVAAPGTNFLEYQITSTLTDAGSYDTFPVSYIGGAGTIANNTIVSVVFLRAGDKGADGVGTGDVVGPASSVDSELALFNSTTGKLIKRASLTGIVKATSGVASAATAGTDYVAPSGALGTPSSGTLTNCTGLPAAGLVASTSQAVGFGSIELGHATDTTLSRSAAGELAVEGVVVKKVGKETIYVPAGAMVSRTTNGAAAGSAETTTNKVMLKTLDYDTTTQEFAQFSIRMPKSWNEGTITAAFTWSHAATTTNFGVVWALEAVALSDGDAGDTAFGTAQQVADTGGTTNTIYVTSATAAITIAGTPAAEDWVVFQVKRVPSDGSDTMAIDARLHGVTVYITTDASTDA
jgi:hypothetical protein